MEVPLVISPKLKTTGPGTCILNVSPVCMHLFLNILLFCIGLQ